MALGGMPPAATGVHANRARAAVLIARGAKLLPNLL